jgi:uncharacterized protein YybS (DUF2232 family)
MNPTEGSPEILRGSPGKEIAAGLFVTVILFLSMYLVPLGGFLGGVLTPLPTLLSVAKWGRPLGYIVPGGAALVCFPLLASLDLVEGIPYLCCLLCAGALLGVAARRRWPAQKAVPLAGLVVAGTGALLVWLASRQAGGGLAEFMEQYSRDAIKSAFALLGPDSAEHASIEAAMLAAVPFFVRLAPGMIVSSALLISWLNLLLARKYARICSVPELAWEDWSRWRAPEHLVWGVVGGGFAALAAGGFLKYAGVNLLLAAGTVYFLQGLAVIGFYFDRWKLPRVFRAAVYAILLMQQFASLGAVLIGLFDMWLDFRRLARKAEA